MNNIFNIISNLFFDDPKSGKDLLSISGKLFEINMDKKRFKSLFPPGASIVIHSTDYNIKLDVFRNKEDLIDEGELTHISSRVANSMEFQIENPHLLAKNNSSLLEEGEIFLVSWKHELYPGRVMFVMDESTTRPTFDFFINIISDHLSSECQVKPGEKPPRIVSDRCLDTMDSSFGNLDISDRENVVTEEDDKYVKIYDLKESNSDDSVNTSMSQSFLYDRALVAKPGKIDIFIPGEKEMEYTNSILGICDAKNREPLSCSQTMMFDSESSLLFLDPNNKKTIHQVDLERSDIVEEWDTGGHDVSQICQTSKYDQKTGNKTFLGLNDQGIFMMDSRLPKSKVIESRSKYFTRGVGKNMDLSCFGVSGNGDLAIGNSLGEVRLLPKNIWENSPRDWVSKEYSDIGLVKNDGGIGGKIRSKTKFPSVGSPITSIDITEDGSLVLCTTKTFLILLSTVIPNYHYSGFERSMGENKRQIYLELSQEDVRLVGGTVHFTNSKFNINNERVRYIFATTGSFVITWSFTFDGNYLRVSDKPQIKRYSENVVSGEFRYQNNDRQDILIATDHQVKLAKKRQRLID
jgi:hypothetical protein